MHARWVLREGSVVGFKANFGVDLPDRLRVAKRLRRWGVLTVAALLVVSACLVAEPEWGGQGFPVGGLGWLLGDPVTAALPVVGGLPVQRDGGAPGPQHVPAADTSAHGGAGRAPGTGVGALPAAGTADRPLAAPGTTPVLTGEHSFSPAHSTRIASAASAMSDVYANPDGSYTRKVFQNPVNVKAADGSYVPIDTALQRGADGRIRPKTSALPVELAAAADDVTGDRVAPFRAGGGDHFCRNPASTGRQVPVT